MTVLGWVLIGFGGVGLALTVVALFARKPLIQLGSWEATWGEHGSVRGAEAAGFFAFTAIFVVLAVLFGRADNGSTGGPEGSGPVPTVNAGSEAADRSSAASAAPSSSARPTSTSEPATASPSTTPPRTSAGPSATPPWEATDHGMHLVVEDRQVRPDGRLDLKVRLENNSGTDLSVAARDFLAVDQRNRSFGVDTDNSDFQFDPGQPYPYTSLPFVAGTTRPGHVVLDGVLSPDATTLQVRFTAAHRDSSDYSIAYFTLFVDMAL
jgi:hypothetical protein